MGRRKKKTSLFEDLLNMTSKFPWYIGIALAVISYLILSKLAVPPDLLKSGGLANITSIVFPQMIYFLSFVGQFLLPLIFFIGAGVSFKNQLQKVKRDNPSPWSNSRSNAASNSASVASHKPDRFYRKTVSNASDTWSLELIRKIEWRSFEKLSAEYFLAKGYKVVETGAGKDGGVDLYLFKLLKDDGLKYDHKPFSAIQCKSWLTKQIGVKTVRELYGVMAAENIKLGAVVASGYFTDDAIEFAKSKHVQLINGAKLLKLIMALPADTQSNLLKKITAGDYTTPTCPTCDIKMIKRTSKKSNSDGLPFWGCGNFPKCRHIQYISK